MLIKHEELRFEIKKILELGKTRHKIVKEIKNKGNKFHFFQLTNFMEGKDVSLSTLEKIDEYVNQK